MRERKMYGKKGEDGRQKVDETEVKMAVTVITLFV